MVVIMIVALWFRDGDVSVGDAGGAMDRYELFWVVFHDTCHY